jgi:hypothetical protein
MTYNEAQRTAAHYRRRGHTNAKPARLADVWVVKYFDSRKCRVTVHYPVRYKPLRSPKDKRAKCVIQAEKLGLMKKDCLYLTSGGRIVKPSWGEHASEKFNDIMLMDMKELEAGVKLEVFHKRYMKARRKWLRRKK